MYGILHPILPTPNLWQRHAGYYFLILDLANEGFAWGETIETRVALEPRVRAACLEGLLE